MSYNPDKHHRRSIRLPGHDYTCAGAYFVTICTHDRGCLFGQVEAGQVQLNAYGRIVLSRWRALQRSFSQLRLDAFVVMPNHVHGILILGEGPSARYDDNADTLVGRGEASDRPAASVLSGHVRAGFMGGAVPADASPVAMVALAEQGEASERPVASVLSGNVGAGCMGGAFPADASPLRRRGPARPAGTDPGSLGAVVQFFKSTVTRTINRRRKTPGGQVWQRNYYERILRTEHEWRACRHYIEQNPARWDEDKNHPDRF